jgi:hypothetical protein
MNHLMGHQFPLPLWRSSRDTVGIYVFIANHQYTVRNSPLRFQRSVHTVQTRGAIKVAFDDKQLMGTAFAETVKEAVLPHRALQLVHLPFREGIY